MQQVTAYQAIDGSLHATPEGAKRIDDSVSLKPLLAKLNDCFERAKATNLEPSFGLLAFIRENWNLISTFKPQGKQSN